MNNLILLTFGLPSHGWLPVNFNYNGFNLNFDASGVLNDPIEELYNAVTKLQNNEVRRIIWWNEPGAYFFEITKTENNVSLQIIETEDLHKESANKSILLNVTGELEQIISPFRKALKEFGTLVYDQKSWKTIIDKPKFDKL